MLIISVCYTNVFGFDQLFNELKQNFLKHLKNPEASISLCYKVEKNKWTDFHLPRATDRVKIITNANISKQAPYDPETPMNYALEFQLCDRKDNIIRSGQYHQNTKISQYKGKSENNSQTASYYFKEPLTPADGRVVILDFNEIPDTEDLKMRFRLVSHDSIISDVVMRLYLPEITPESNLKHMWKRTGKEKRERLSSFNIYPQELLTESEQINLIRQTWRPMAPHGSDGINYVSRKLYVINEMEGSSFQQTDFQRGALIDKSFRVTLPIPEQGMQLKFLFSELQTRSGDEPPSIKLKWFGKKLKTDEWCIPWDKDETVFQQYIPGGIIELTSDQQVTALIYQIDADQEIDITPEPLSARAFVLDQNDHLTYRISHVKDLYTPFRASFRKRVTEGALGSETIQYTLLDSNAIEIKKDKIQVDLTPSFYDSIIEQKSRVILSDPVSLYFKLPSKVAYIRFSSSGPMLINAYNRPPQMVNLTHVPEDYYKITNKEDKKQTSWFPISPLEFSDLLKLQRSILMKLQYRPPDLNDDLSSGNFIWESFESRDNGKGHYLLTPSETKQYQRDASLISNYKEIPLNKPISINFKSQGPLKVMRPKMIFYQKNQSRPFTIKITNDGRDYFKKDLIGSTGVLILPPVAAGKHLITLTSSGTIKPFLNLINSKDAGYNLRFASSLTRKGIMLDYTKFSNDDENLSLALFFSQENQAPERLIFSIEIQGESLTDDGPFSSFTLLKRRYSVRPDNNGPVYVLNSSIPILGSWQNCFFPIRSDLKPGRYKIKIVLEQGPEGYIVPYRVTPGVYPERKLMWEQKL